MNYHIRGHKNKNTTFFKNIFDVFDVKIITPSIYTEEGVKFFLISVVDQAQKILYNLWYKLNVETSERQDITNEKKDY